METFRMEVREGRKRALELRKGWWRVAIFQLMYHACGTRRAWGCSYFILLVGGIL
jgi:hypothetical protein